MATNDFQRNFDPATYLELSFKNPGPGLSAIYNFAQENLHQFFKDYPQGHSLKVLDYGCGPVIAHNISAARVASEIVLAEYTKRSRESIKKWLDHDPSAFDWSPYFKHVVQTIEGKSVMEALEREEMMRKVIKAIVDCDITKDQPIAEGFEGPYDVVISSLAIESACETHADFKAAIKKLLTLLKHGGHFLLYIGIRNREGLGCYYTGEQKFHTLCLPEQFVLTTLRESGLTIIRNNPLSEERTMAVRHIEPSMPTDLEYTTFIVAVKPGH